jgi:hypothetical protein
VKFKCGNIVVWEAVAKGGEGGEMMAKLAVENILRIGI